MNDIFSGKSACKPVSHSQHRKQGKEIKDPTNLIVDLVVNSIFFEFILSGIIQYGYNLFLQSYKWCAVSWIFAWLFTSCLIVILLPSIALCRKKNVMYAMFVFYILPWIGLRCMWYPINYTLDQLVRMLLPYDRCLAIKMSYSAQVLGGLTCFCLTICRDGMLNCILQGINDNLAALQGCFDEIRNQLEKIKNPLEPDESKSIDPCYPHYKGKKPGHGPFKASKTK